MERLPYIDEHSIDIGATRERVWQVLGSVLAEDLGGAAAAPLVRLLGLAPAQRHGDRRGELQAGDALPGFAVLEALPPKRLALRGRHRFSRYALELELELERAGDGAGAGAGAEACTLRARTRAAFPGLCGRAYRALVIGSAIHRRLVRRMLRNVARRV